MDADADAHLEEDLEEDLRETGTPRLLPFLLAFVVLTAPLAYVWLEWGSDLYARALLGIVGPRDPAAGMPGNAAVPRFISVVPFLVLMWVTPGLEWRRRLWGSLLGLVLLAIVHLALLSLVLRGSGSGQESIARYFPFLVLADGAPLLLWVVFARDFGRSVIPGLEEHPQRGGPA